MGVIDLDARVKKLEQDAGGGAVIDQLEAAVTALEETVNGDGETDLGLVGDVAALETTVGNLIEDVTSKITLSEGVTLNTQEVNYYKAYRVGNIIFLHANLSFATGYPSGAERFHALDLDSTIAPASVTTIIGLGGGTGTEMIFQVSPSGFITAGGISGKNMYANFSAFWTIAAPAETTE